MASIHSPQPHSAVESIQPPAPTEPSHLVSNLVIRGLPANIAHSDLHYLVTGFGNVVHYQPADCADGPVAARTRSVLVQVKALETVSDAQKTVTDIQTELNARGATVEFCGYGMARSSRPSSNGTSPATRPASTSQAATRSGGAVFPLPTPTTNGSHVRNGNGNGNSNGNGHGFNMPQTPYSAQSPIGNHLNNSQPRVSSRDLIMDDDNPFDFMNLQPYQAQNGSNLNSRAHENRPTNTNGQSRYADTTPTQRRATAPHLQVSTLDAHMSSLSIRNGTNGTSAAQRGNVSMYSQSVNPGVNPGIMSVMQGNMQTAHHYPFNRRIPPAANPADKNEPCNTLYVGNLPVDAQEEDLRQLFSMCRGYKRMCYRTKNNGPMCFVEFDDTSCATRAMEALYGVMLPTCKKGGLRLSFSKNPLGVRGPQAGGPHGAMGGHHSMMGHNQNGFATATGPPPGLHPYTAPPPGLGPISSASYAVPTSMANSAMTNGNGIGSPNASNMAYGTSYAGTSYPSQTINSYNNNALGMGTANGFHIANDTSYASQPTNGNAHNNIALGMGTANGYHTANGTSHAAQYTNGNNALGNSLGNGTSVDHRSQQSFTGSWPRSFNATPTYTSAHYTPPHTSASVGNGYNSFARDSRPAQS